MIVLAFTIGVTVSACQPPMPTSQVLTLPPVIPPRTTQTPDPPPAQQRTLTYPHSTPTPILTEVLTCMPTYTHGPSPTPPVPTPLGEAPENVYQALMAPSYEGYWWRQMDDGVKMVFAVLSYMELRTIRWHSSAIVAATEALARRYWYACSTGCKIENGVIDGGLRWVMRFSQSLMSIADGIPLDLAQSSIDPAFAIQMADDITRPANSSWKNTNWNRPWGWFNTQTIQEWDYFSQAWNEDQGNVSPMGVYYMIVEQPPISFVVLTQMQIGEHCNEPNYCGRPVGGR